MGVVCLNHLVTVDSSEGKREAPLFLSEIFARQQQVIPTCSQNDIAFMSELGDRLICLVRVNSEKLKLPT